MPVITVTLPSDGDSALAENIDDPINAILAVVNGNLDDANIASMNGSKIVAGSLPPTAFSTATAQGWNPISQTLTYSANNGNKEFVVGTSSSLAAIVSVGQKISIARGIAPPTQCMAFAAASSQYATKATPTGITFTGDWSGEAWIYLLSYPASGSYPIIGRTDNSTAGFLMYINPSGQLIATYGASSTFTTITTSQSIPLNRWVHVAAAVSAAAKTAVTTINGISVANTSSGTATTVAQTANLSVGTYNTGAANNYFNGYISEARVWSIAQSLANIQANMAINLAGSETNLVALFQGGGNFNDKTANANNLTATNGPIATQANNPYNATEYGIITAITPTQLTIFTGTAGSIPNQILGTAAYSSGRAPFGFPAARGKWSVLTLGKTASSQSSPTNATWYNLGGQLSIPTGEWNVIYEGGLSGTAGAATDILLRATLSTANNSETDNINTSDSRFTTLSVGRFPLQRKLPNSLSLASQTIYYLNALSAANSITSVSFEGGLSPTIIEAECAYI